MELKIEMAPLEGVTTSYFRRIQSRHFTPADRYFTPFISPTQNHCFTPRILGEISPRVNEGLNVIPQLIGHNADDFLWATNELKAMGYKEVNLNLGCPSPTVTKKKKGAGMLGDIPYLHEFLDRIFSESPVEISVKTRIGRTSYEEAEALAELFSHYPIKELIVHPRLEKDFYKGPVSDESYRIFLRHNPEITVYNGDLFNTDKIKEFSESFPGTGTVMCGRGFIANPKLAGEIKGEGPLTKDEFKDFYDEFFALTRERLPNETQLLLHMKEYWAYWGGIFENAEKEIRQLYKSKSVSDYTLSAAKLFSQHNIVSPAGFYTK